MVWQMMRGADGESPITISNFLTDGLVDDDGGGC
jgi:hypothetical protein